MNGIIIFAVRLVLAVKQAYERKAHFLGLFAFIFVGSVIILGHLDLLPDTEPALVAMANSAGTDLIPTIESAKLAELPAKIEIPKVNISAIILNPTAIDIAVLDKELLRGAVRYPTSAKLGETGNVVLFGHSSYLPIVGNQAYKTFNGIQKLVAGDIVTVYSSAAAYAYRVRSVEVKNTTIDGIRLSTAGRMLTLVTCNSFGAKEERFIITAEFVESHSISR